MLLIPHGDWMPDCKMSDDLFCWSCLTWVECCQIHQTQMLGECSSNTLYDGDDIFRVGSEQAQKEQVKEVAGDDGVELASLVSIGTDSIVELIVIYLPCFSSSLPVCISGIWARWADSEGCARYTAACNY